MIAAAVVGLCGMPFRAGAQSRFVSETVDGSSSTLGTFTSLALDASGNPHVSYFDNLIGDLKFARKSAGVWTIETADGSANNVGSHTSLALDASGNPHVSYFDATTGDLKFARKSGGVWTVETADGSANSVGLYTSVALDPSGNPHVSYYDLTTGDLRFARKSGGVWTREMVDGLTSNVGFYSSLALDASGNPHVSYYEGGAAGDLKYARKSGNSWTIETADGSPNFVGSYCSLDLDASGNAHVSYYDANTNDLKYARKSGGVWTIETADASANDVGTFSSLALDASGNPHVSYRDGTTDDLKCARKSGSTWTIEIVDGSANDAGDHSSVALDAQGNPHVSYHDGTTDDLKYASAAVHLLSPTPGVTWAVGSRQSVAWSGIGTVDLFLTSDGTSYEELLADNVIASPIPIRVPHIPSRFARLILVRSSPFSTSATDSFFTINATVALAKFEAARGADGAGTRLTWETQPGPEADIRYRVERAADGVAFSMIASGLDRFEYVDPSPSGASHYRLVAINGLGEEFVLGETRATSGMDVDRDLAAFPNPASGPIEISYRVRDARSVDLAIYDASGRRVRTIASGTAALGIQSATWDRRDDSGRDVAAGVYFARLAGAGEYPAMERLTIVR